MRRQRAHLVAFLISVSASGESSAFQKGVDGLPEENGVEDRLDRVPGQDDRILGQYQSCEDLHAPLLAMRI